MNPRMLVVVFLALTTILLVLAPAVVARSLTQVDEFPCPVHDPAFALDYDPQTRTLWSVDNQGYATGLRLWNFDLQGNLIADWPAYVRSFNLLGVAVDTVGDRVFYWQNFGRNLSQSRTDGTWLRTVQLPWGYQNSTGRIEFDDNSGLVVMPYTSSSSGPEGFINVSPETGEILYTEPFDFELEGGFSFVTGFALTSDSYWVLGLDQSLENLILVAIDRPTLQVVETFRVLDGAWGDFQGLALDSESSLFYVLHNSQNTVKVFRIAELGFATPECWQTITARPRETVSFPVNVEDEPGRSIHLDVADLPPGAWMDPALPTSGNPVSSVFTWMPVDDDAISSHTVVFTATNDALVPDVETCEVTIEIGPPGPEVLEMALERAVATIGTESSGGSSATVTSLDVRLATTYDDFPPPDRGIEFESLTPADVGSTIRITTDEDFDFPEFASMITDGIDGWVWEDYHTNGGGGTGTRESRFFGAQAGSNGIDLEGYSIASIALTVDQLTLDYTETWTDYSFQGTYRFNGQFECGLVLQVNAGDTVTFTAAAADDPRRIVTMDAAGLPPGSLVAPLLPVAGNPALSDFTWVTDEDDANTEHTVVFTATNDAPEPDTLACPVTIEVVEPLLVTLRSFTATPDDGLVTLRWTTESEVDNAGFYLLRRGVVTGKTARLNNGLIPGRGDVFQGAEYTYVDDTAVNGVDYQYLLVDVDLFGRETSHPGVRAVPNPLDPPIKLLSPQYGATVSLTDRPVFGWTPRTARGQILKLSIDPTFTDDLATVSIAVRGSRAGADRRSAWNVKQRAAIDDLARRAAGQPLYWRVEQLDRGWGLEASDTFSLWIVTVIDGDTRRPISAVGSRNHDSRPMGIPGRRRP